MTFIASNAAIPDAFVNALNEFARTRQVEGQPLPIRVIGGRFQVTQPTAWTGEEAEACGVSADFAQQHGVTIINWGSASDTFGRAWAQFPGAMYADGQPRDPQISETLHITDGATRQAIGYAPWTDAEGNLAELGEYGERTVWFFTNLTYTPDPELVNIDEFLIEPIRRCTEPDFMERFRQEQLDASARAFAARMVHDPERRIRSARDRIVNSERSLRGHEEEIVRLRTELQFAQREVDAILQMSEVGEEHWRSEWEKMMSHPMIIPGTLQMSGNALTFDTVLLNINDVETGDDLPLGNFRVKVDFESHEVRIENLNNRRHNRDHPHVESGGPCFGGYHAEVIDHIQNNRISALIEFLFGYLQTYNPDDDWGRYIQYWRESPGLVGAA